MAVSRLVAITKSITAKEIFKKKPELEEGTMGIEFMDKWILCFDSRKAQE
jgi:hypothetical protein